MPKKLSAHAYMHMRICIGMNLNAYTLISFGKHTIPPTLPQGVQGAYLVILDT